MAGPESKKIAVLIDGDQVNGPDWPGIRKVAKAMGTIVRLQSFSNGDGLGRVKEWMKHLEPEDLTLPWQFSPRSTNNAADMMLTIAAVELGFEGGVSGFLIVSGNAKDFVPVKEWLVAKGFRAEIYSPPPAAKPSPVVEPAAKPEPVVKAVAPAKLTQAAPPKPAAKHAAQLEEFRQLLPLAFERALAKVSAPDQERGPGHSEVLAIFSAISNEWKKANKGVKVPSFDALLKESSFESHKVGRKAYIRRKKP